MANKKLDSNSPEMIALSVVQGKCNINELNLLKAVHREALVSTLAQRPHLIAKINEANTPTFAKYVIEKNPELFVYLNKEQYSDELAQLYLFHRFSDKHPRGKNDERFHTLTLQKSIDNKIIFNYSYVTPEGEELYYLDSELQVPTSIKSSLKLSLKINDAVKLIEKLDVHVTQLGEKKISATLCDIVSNRYKSFLSSYISENKVGYYTLCTSFAALEKGFSEYLDSALSEYGISVSSFIVKNLAIPKDIQFKIEDQSFRIRQRRAEIEADAEFAKVSLKNYEAKLAINEKYQAGEGSLTEYEKDLALQRYLTKCGRAQEESVDRSIRIAQKVDGTDDVVSKKTDVVPELPPVKNMFKRLFILSSVVLAILSFAVMSGSVGAGFITLGISTAILGTVAAFKHEKFAKIEPELDRGGFGDDE